jgi:aspartate racemase
MNKHHLTDMKVLGMIGGLSWESTQHYYQIMNRDIQEKLGGSNSIEAIIYSINFERIKASLDKNDWDAIGKDIIEIAKKIECAGASFLIITSNAAHKIADEIAAQIDIPLLHIVDPTAKAIKQAKITKVGLIGTSVTMEEAFYKDRLKNTHGIEVIIPEKSDRDCIQRIIFEELTAGQLSPTSKNTLCNIISTLVKSGAEAVILGCTELTLLIGQKDTSTILFDTTELHAKAAVNALLNSQ